MSLLIKWPRTSLYALTLLILVGCADTGASPPQQTAPPPSAATPISAVTSSYLPTPVGSVVLPAAQPSGVPPPTHRPTVQPTLPPSPTPDTRPTLPPPPTSTPSPPRPLTDPLPDPKQAGVTWFPQTGHTLRSTFLDYWNKHGGLAQFGYPLTEEFFEPVGVGADNKLYQVQYFERARFELHPENAGKPSEVLLGALGRELAERKSYFAGVYPPYGHAADFSWVSGKLILFGPMQGACYTCGCSLLQYGDENTRFQLGGNAWWYEKIGNYDGVRQAGISLVVWGKPLLADAGYTGESIFGCPPYHVAIYIVNQVQINLAP